KTRTILALAAFAGLSGAASAQVPTTQNSTVSFVLSFQDTGNHNGILEPGESALITMNVSFTGQNTVGSFTPPVGSFSSGTIRGLATGFVDLNGTANNGGNANGNWNVQDAIDPTWDLIGPTGWGTPAAAGSNLQNIQFGQFPFSPDVINTQNPIDNVWHATWTPASLAVRTVTFTVGDGAASGGLGSAVEVRVGTANVLAAYTPESYGHLTLP